MPTKVQAVVNPALWRYTDRVQIGEHVFTHDQPVALTPEEYEVISAHKIAYAGGEHQLVVHATPKLAAEAEADDVGEKPAEIAKGGRDK